MTAGSRTWIAILGAILLTALSLSASISVGLRLPTQTSLPALPEGTRLRAPSAASLPFAGARSSLIREVLPGSPQPPQVLQRKIRQTNRLVPECISEVITAGGNDAFSRAALIGCLPFTAPAHLTNATLEAGEEQPCGVIKRSVWYRFSPSVPTEFVVRVSGSGFDPALAVFGGSSLTDLTFIACRDKAESEGIAAVPGRTYFFQVGTDQDPAVDVPGTATREDLLGPSELVAQFSVTAVPASESVISTFIGSSRESTALGTGLFSPNSVVVGPKGDLYIADTHNYRIRRIDRRGAITTVAGKGLYGYARGDEGPATQAGFSGPSDVAFDAAGNLYIADESDNRVRKVDRRGIITTVAGPGQGQGCVGTPAAVGDGGPATAATLCGPSGLAFDAAGNLYIADSDNNRIRKVDGAGTIRTVAGSGVYGYFGDGGPATQAGLWNPTDVTLDAAGNLFIADTENHRIRKVDRAGTISTVAGNNITFLDQGYSGDGGPATNAKLFRPRGLALDDAGNLFIADSDNDRIRKVDRSGAIMTIAGNGSYGFSGDGGPADEAAIAFPAGITVDGAGSLYIADRRNDRIRKVSPSGVIDTVAGKGHVISTSYGYSGDGGHANEARLNYPDGVAFDAPGNLYFADSGNNRIRKIDRRGIITTVAGNGLSGYSGDGGPAPRASLANPRDVAIDGAGNMYIADSGNNRIRKVDRAGKISTFAGTATGAYGGDGGPATQASLNFPSGVAADADGNVYISDTINSRIRKVDHFGVITTFAGVGVPSFFGDGGPATRAGLALPDGLAFDAAGNLYIADAFNNRIRKVDRSGTITTVAGSGLTGGSYASLAGGTYSGDGGPATQARLAEPADVAADGAGNVYIADAGNNRIRRIDGRGVITTVAGNGQAGSAGDGGSATNARLAYPLSVATRSGGFVLSDSNNHRIRAVDQSGVIKTVAGGSPSHVPPALGDGGPASRASLSIPRDVVIDGEGSILIADTGNNRIRKVDRHGVITTVAGNGDFGDPSSDNGDGGTAVEARLAQPRGVAVAADGTIYIADSYNHRIRKVDPGGRITTVAGPGPWNCDGYMPYQGDDGPAEQASLCGPEDVALDSDGNLYIADTGNGRIRKVDREGTITTVAGAGLFAGNPRDGGPATQALLSGPTGIALDQDGDLFIAEAYACKIRKVDRSSGLISTVAGRGTCGLSGDGRPATQALLSSPERVTLDPAGDLFISDTGNNRVRRVDRSGMITTVAGNSEFGFAGEGGPSRRASLAAPAGLVSDGKSLFIADSGNDRVRVVRSPRATLGSRIPGVTPTRNIPSGPPASARVLGARAWAEGTLTPEAARPMSVRGRAPEMPARGLPVAAAVALLGLAAAGHVARRMFEQGPERAPS